MDELRAFLFGATLAAAIGPIALLIIHCGAQHGIRAALTSAAGVATADFIYALVAFAAGSGLTTLLHTRQLVFDVIASTLLLGIGLWLGMGALRVTPAAAPTTPRRIGFAATLLLTLANPLTIVLFAGFAGQLALSSRWTEAIYFAGYIFAGSLPVQASYALFGALLHRLAPGPATMRGLNLASCAGIIAFGIFGLVRVSAQA